MASSSSRSRHRHPSSTSVGGKTRCLIEKHGQLTENDMGSIALQNEPSGQRASVGRLISTDSSVGNTSCSEEESSMDGAIGSNSPRGTTPPTLSASTVAEPITRRRSLRDPSGGRRAPCPFVDGARQIKRPYQSRLEVSKAKSSEEEASTSSPQSSGMNTSSKHKGKCKKRGRQEAHVSSAAKRLGKPTSTALSSGATAGSSTHKTRHTEAALSRHMEHSSCRRADPVGNTPTASEVVDLSISSPQEVIHLDLDDSPSLPPPRRRNGVMGTYGASGMSTVTGARSYGASSSNLEHLQALGASYTADTSPDPRIDTREAQLPAQPGADEEVQDYSPSLLLRPASIDLSASRPSRQSARFRVSSSLSNDGVSGGIGENPLHGIARVREGPRVSQNQTSYAMARRSVPAAEASMENRESASLNRGGTMLLSEDTSRFATRTRRDERSRQEILDHEIALRLYHEEVARVSRGLSPTAAPEISSRGGVGASSGGSSNGAQTTPMRDSLWDDTDEEDLTDVERGMGSGVTNSVSARSSYGQDLRNRTGLGRGNGRHRMSRTSRGSRGAARSRSCSRDGFPPSRDEDVIAVSTVARSASASTSATNVRNRSGDNTASTRTTRGRASQGSRTPRTAASASSSRGVQAVNGGDNQHSSSPVSRQLEARQDRGRASSRRAQGRRSSSSSVSNRRNERTNNGGSRSSSQGAASGRGSGRQMHLVVVEHLVAHGLFGNDLAQGFDFVGGFMPLPEGDGIHGVSNPRHIGLMQRNLGPGDYQELLDLDDGAGNGHGARNGLSSMELSRLPSQKGNGTGPTEQCCICMEDMLPTETITRLPACLHTFHRKCISTWLRTRATCPVDKTEVTVSNP